jgi:hypothetical protein
MPVTRFASNPPPAEPVELSAQGFPFAEQEIREWKLGLSCPRWLPEILG